MQCEELGDRGDRGRRRRDLRGRRSATRSTRRWAFGGVDIVVSNAGIASSAPIEETTLAEWNRNQSILGTGYFLVAREAFRVLRAQGTGGSVVFVASKNALVAGQNAAAYSSAKAAELHLARCLAEEGGSARHPREHRQPRRGAARLADLGLELARGAGRGVWHRPRGPRGALPEPHRARRAHPPRGHRTGGPAFRLRRSARARARATCSTSTVASRPPTRVSDDDRFYANLLT